MGSTSCDLAGAPFDCAPASHAQDKLLAQQRYYNFCDLAGAPFGYAPASPAQDKLLAQNQYINKFVTWLGLEPRTTSLKGRCSTN